MAFKASGRFDFLLTVVNSLYCHHLLYYHKAFKNVIALLL